MAIAFTNIKKRNRLHFQELIHSIQNELHLSVKNGIANYP
jgi:hypothetical protein